MLYLSQDFFSELYARLRSAEKEVVICSAFIKHDAIKKLLEVVGERVNIKVVARWQKADLLSGASDLEVYELCKERDWGFGVDNLLHGKVYLVDQTDLFLGSANLTKKGLGLGAVGNNEFGTRLKADVLDIAKLRSYMNAEVFWMDDEVYSRIKKEVLEFDGERKSHEEWSEDIKQRFKCPVHSIWVSELPCCSPSELLNSNHTDENIVADLATFNMDSPEIDEITLVNKALKTRFCRWMMELIEREGDCSFGRVTKELHDSLIDDPKPYRRTVKEYVQTMFLWMEFLSNEFEVYRPRYSQVVKLKESING